MSIACYTHYITVYYYLSGITDHHLDNALCFRIAATLKGLRRPTRAIVIILLTEVQIFNS